MTNLEAVRSKYHELCEQLGVPDALHTAPCHDGAPHIERAGDEYCYVVTERGAERERRCTGDPDELLYWLIGRVVFNLAARHELFHRVPGKDSRRILFAREVELMAQLRPAWATRRSAEIERILTVHPYRDERE